MKSGLFIIDKNRLFTSDWHIFHKNVWKYEDRFTFINKSEENLVYADKMSQISQDDRDKIVLENDFIFFSKVFTELKQTIEKYKITEFYCLGDFIFEFSTTRLERIKNTNRKMYGLILDIFLYLKEKKVKRILILGNHDKIKEECMIFYKRLFDTVEPYIYRESEGVLISHVPVNRLNLPVKDSCVNYLLGPILGIVKKQLRLTNYHGHTHSSSPKTLIEGDKGVKYINCCLDAHLK